MQLKMICLIIWRVGKRLKRLEQDTEVLIKEFRKEYVRMRVSTLECTKFD